MIAEDDFLIEEQIFRRLVVVAADRAKEAQQPNKTEIRYLKNALQTKVTTFVIDHEFSLVVESKDKAREDSYDAIGLATYSNSESTVLSYVSIFETLWMQSKALERRML